MSKPEALVVVYDRTSGDEHEGQDGAAQLAQTVHRAAALGLVVVAEDRDEDMPGDSPWAARRGLERALVLTTRYGAALVVREVSRLWRGHPGEGLGLLARLPDLVVLDAPGFERRGGAWVDDSEEAELVRFIGLWSSWAEKRRTARRSALAMAEIVAGRRRTESGKPPGRPVVEIDPAHVEEARRLRAAGASWTDVRAAVLRLRGYDDVKDPDAKKRRDVSVDSIKRALGAKPPGPGQKSDPGRTQAATASGGPGANESLLPLAVGAQNTIPAGTSPPVATGGAGGTVTPTDGSVSS